MLVEKTYSSGEYSVGVLVAFHRFLCVMIARHLCVRNGVRKRTKVNKIDTFKKRKSLQVNDLQAFFSAQDWIRTSTPLRALRPEHSASTNFATWAGNPSGLVSFDFRPSVFVFGGANIAIFQFEQKKQTIILRHLLFSSQLAIHRSPPTPYPPPVP